jgi:hypothetical protein
MELRDIAAEIAAIAERPDRWGDAAALVPAAAGRLHRSRIADLREFRRSIEAIEDRLASRHASPAGDALRGVIRAFLALCDDARPGVETRTCPRCGANAGTHHVVVRPLSPPERRVCDDCKDAFAAKGWAVLSTDPVDVWCFDCRRRSSRRSHVIGPVPCAYQLRVCDRCKDDLASAGWRAAVTVVMS